MLVEKWKSNFLFEKQIKKLKKKHLIKKWRPMIDEFGEMFFLSARVQRHKSNTTKHRITGRTSMPRTRLHPIDRGNGKRKRNNTWALSWTMLTPKDWKSCWRWGRGWAVRMLDAGRTPDLETPRAMLSAMFPAPMKPRLKMSVDGTAMTAPKPRPPWHCDSSLPVDEKGGLFPINTLTTNRLRRGFYNGQNLIYFKWVVYRILAKKNFQSNKMSKIHLEYYCIY